MPQDNSSRQSRKPRNRQRPNSLSNPRRTVAPSSLPASAPPGERGLLGWLGRNRRLLGWLELFVAILLVGLAINGFLGGGLYIPFAFGLLGLRFFYAYVQHGLGVNFGRTALVLNLVLLLGALIFVILGLTIEPNNN